jgi:hypothetical protein
VFGILYSHFLFCTSQQSANLLAVCLIYEPLNTEGSSLKFECVQPYLFTIQGHFQNFPSVYRFEFWDIILIVFETGSQYSPVWLPSLGPTASTSQVLGFQACTTSDKYWFSSIIDVTASVHGHFVYGNVYILIELEYTLPMAQQWVLCVSFTYCSVFFF